MSLAGRRVPRKGGDRPGPESARRGCPDPANGPLGAPAGRYGAPGRGARVVAPLPCDRPASAFVAGGDGERSPVLSIDRRGTMPAAARASHRPAVETGASRVRPAVGSLRRDRYTARKSASWRPRWANPRRAPSRWARSSSTSRTRRPARATSIVIPIRARRERAAARGGGREGALPGDRGRHRQRRSAAAPPSGRTRARRPGHRPRGGRRRRRRDRRRPRAPRRRAPRAAGPSRRGRRRRARTPAAPAPRRAGARRAAASVAAPPLPRCRGAVTTSAPPARPAAAVPSADASSATSTRASGNASRRAASVAAAGDRPPRTPRRRRRFRRLSSRPHRCYRRRRALAVAEVEAHITGTVWKVEVDVGDAVGRATPS